MLICDAQADMKARKAGWEDDIPDGGESGGQVAERMTAFFKTLCQSVYDKNKASTEGEEPCETILVVSHGAALRMFYGHLQKTLNCTLPEGPLEVFPRNTAYSDFTVR